MEAIVVAVLGVLCALLGGIEVFRTRAQSLLAWACVAAGVAILLIALP